MRITYYHRRPFDGAYSIERLFRDIRNALPKEIEYEVSTSRFESRGLFKRLYNCIEAIFKQGDINHITGDIHYIALLLSKKKTVLTICDCVALRRLNGIKKFILFLLWYWLPEKRVALITAISESTKKEILSYLKCNPDKIRVISCCVAPEFQYNPYVFNIHKPKILQVGTNPNKNLIRVAHALKGIPCHLQIIGKLNEEQKRVLADCGIEYSSKANIPDSEMVEVYRDCDLVIFASTYEGFGLPIIEANATGRPVVTSNFPPMSEVAGDSACLVAPFDVESIRNGILRVIQDSKYREQLIQNGLKNAMRFKPEIIANQYVEIYKELLNSRKSV